MDRFDRRLPSVRMLSELPTARADRQALAGLGEPYTPGSPLHQSRGDQGDWHTLVDLSGGQFVARLLAGDEMFARSEVNIRRLLPPRRRPCRRGLHRKL
ncbi:MULTISPECIES: hypothetical protein [unclassified Mesorhizobium]|uniref:hypothetical protein n=1 Tax=unclassified Mesorhizobium TaxID=325217 RepID=UPI000FE81C90|nr:MULTISPECIES: hypothetical protein [unclassified Mesorhizobium]RWI30039.1 MAG: hypothetical protein EOQ92_00980 [Mesorhizobium sp.]RWK53386.1 MAG: hypothetical protein EOR47_01235 [Mesorhizobium sp.]RWK98409.1 MAG: hypothetical protein EOR53_01690 [Mesorhizobium sp.]RWL03082.1 MAG: hypothetical protein EOR45_15420 [Mesorhizobium sp.]TIP61491.1 MAG: hypothetical protein E5X56_01060 [Mesorhizobium sp.]